MSAAAGAGAGAVVVAVEAEAEAEAVEAVAAAGSVLGGSLVMVLLCVEGGVGGVSISTGDGRGGGDLSEL